MKRKQVWLAAVLSLLMLVFAGTALAAADSLSFAMDLSASEFIEPKTVSVSFTVTNTGSDDMPGPVKLFYPDGQQVAEFGEPVLAAGASRNWTGNWTVTRGELEAGKISFKVVYSDHDENGEVKEYALAVSKRIQYKGAEPKIEVTRAIMPAVAQEGQTVSIIYDIANTGSADITGVTIQDSAAGKEKESVGDIPAGETVRHIFTVTMKKKDVTSQATLTYKANRKTYTSKVDAAVIKYGKVNLTAQLAADKKGGVPGETVKLTLTLKNSGKEDFTDITVTDETLGTVFSGQAVKAGETVKLEKDLTITESQELLFTVRGSDSAGGQVETATGKVEITAKDPSRQILLAVEAAADKTEVYPIPGGVVRFTITVTNEGNIDAENVSVKAGSATMYTFGRIPAGESRSFTREAEISMAGTFQFTAGTKDQLGETVSFSSNTIPITLGSASANSAPAARQGEWPQPKAEGIDVLDLTGYALKDATTEQKTRTEVMNNGLLLINEWHARPADFDESGLKRINEYLGGNEKIQQRNYQIRLFPAAQDALMEAVTAAREAGLDYYLVAEGYRSWEDQNKLFESRKEKLAGKYSNEEALVEATKKEVNYPGTSEYNSGLSFSLQVYKAGDSEINSQKFASSQQGIWMAENCWKYGLVFRFPEQEWPLATTQDKSYITGVSVKLNLYRYVGKGHAAIMHELGMCLEEYIAYLHEHPHIALYEDGQLRYEVYCQEVGDAESFAVDLTPAAAYTSSLDNMGYVVTVFEH